MSLNLIGVIRLSSDEQAREGKAGSDRQRADIEAIRQRYGANIVRVIEVIESGTRTLDHAEFQQVFRDLADPHIHGVATSNVDRLVRPGKSEDFKIFDYFSLHGKTIYTPGNVLDPRTQSGFMETTIRALFAGLEVQLIRGRTMDGRERLRVAGKNPTPRHILARGVLYDKHLGYRYDVDPDDHSIPRPQGWIPGGALLIKRAFELIAEKDLSFSEVGRLTGMSESHIRRTLADPIWIGVRRYSEKTGGPLIVTDTGYKYRKKMPREEILEVRVFEHGLISEELFYRVQRIIEGRRKTYGERAERTKNKFLLRRLLRCPHGHLYSAEIRRHDKALVYYDRTCGKRMYTRDEVESAVTAMIQRYLLNPDFILYALDAHRAQLQPPIAPSPERALKTADLNRQRERLLDLYQDGDMTKDQYRQRIKAIDEQVKVIDILHPIAKPIPLDLGRVAECLITAFARYAYLPIGDRKDLLRRSFREIRINGGSIEAFTIRGELMAEAFQHHNSRSSLTTAREFATCEDFAVSLPQPLVIQYINQRWL